MEIASLSVIIAFGAGLLSFASPCVLPLVPAYLGHVAASPSNPGFSRRAVLLNSALFVLGFSAIFTILGASFGLIGGLLAAYTSLLRRVAGVFLVLVGLSLVGVLKLPGANWRLPLSPTASWGHLRSVGVGAAFAIGWTPCVGPILGGILALATTSETALEGAYLLASYSLGLGVPFLLAAAAMGSVSSFFKRWRPYYQTMSVAAGILIIAVGVLIFTNTLVRLNAYFDFFGLSRGI